METNKYQTIAVDFDGTLCYSNWPELGAPNKALIAYLQEWRRSGNKLILWTCRAGDALSKAVEWCQHHGLEFDAVNDNLPEVVELYKLIFEYIETFYNTVRIHSHCGYKSPISYENDYLIEMEKELKIAG